MRLRRVALAALVIGSSFASTSARAGGWWSSMDLNGRHIGIGATVNARAEVLFRTASKSLAMRERRSTTRTWPGELTRKL
jgi:S-adenosylmethionine:diacylglycerol 3-amino-3-carboxypropyl transferase